MNPSLPADLANRILIHFLDRREWLIAELSKIGAEKDEIVRREYAISKVHRFLIDVGISADLLHPITSIYGELINDLERRGRSPGNGKTGRPRTPVLESARWVSYAAAASILAERGLSVEHAILAVSEAAGIAEQHKKLADFRKSIGRSDDDRIRIRPEARNEYPKRLAQYRETAAASPDPQRTILEMVRIQSGQVKKKKGVKPHF